MKKLTKKQKLGFIDFYLNERDENLNKAHVLWNDSHFICDSFIDYRIDELKHDKFISLRDAINEFDLVSDYDKVGERYILRGWFRINNEERLFLILFLEQLILDSN